MSIINDALKKAEENTHLCRSNSPYKKWLFWSGTGAVCLLLIFLATNMFEGPADFVSEGPADSVSEETITKPEMAQGALGMRKIELDLSSKSTDFKLSGILYDEQKPMAIINNRIVKEGALINGAELLEIQPNFVRLSRKGKEFSLKVE